MRNPQKRDESGGGVSYVEGAIGLKQGSIDDPDGNIVEWVEPPGIQGPRTGRENLGG